MNSRCDDNDRTEIGPTALAFSEWAESGVTPPDLLRLRQYRLGRVVNELRRRDLAGIVLFDPINIRYATDCPNMQVWTMHNHARACFVSADGYVVLWDFPNSEHLSAHLPLVREVREGATFFFFLTGSRTDEHAEHFSAEIEALLREHAGDNKHLAVDKMEIAGLCHLERRGLDIHDGQRVMEMARVLKSDDEVNAARCALVSTERAMRAMQEAVRPGVAEVDIWSVLHAENIRRGGEWIECRLLSSGPRTNPWFQECGPRIVRAGELLAFDTDLIGPYGMCADLSRTWLIGESAAPTQQQCHLYRVAYDHLQYNIAILEPGLTFNEIVSKAARLPPEYRDQRYAVMMHGVGLCDEYPAIRYPEDVDAVGYDGVLEPGMILAVEAYIGAKGGEEGVKLEDQVLITNDGIENLTHFPFESRLMATTGLAAGAGASL